MMSDNFSYETSGHADHSVQLSKSLSLILRVTAREEGLNIDEHGFVDVDAILRIPRLRKYDQSHVTDLVKKSDKQRYSLRIHPSTGQLQIRANQGHTIPNVNPDLRPVTDASEFPKIIHGTNSRAYELIRFEGLHRMARNHIHFAIGEPGEQGVVSGMSNEASVHIYVDLKKALVEGFKFYESLNRVILCPGNESGFLPSKYFLKVYDTKGVKELDDFVKDEFDIAKYVFKNINQVSKLVHPTSHKLYSKIRRYGLSKTKGNYVNFMTEDPGKDEQYQVMVYLSLEDIKNSNLTFYQFVEGEILCQEEIGLGYVERVLEVKTGIELPF